MLNLFFPGASCGCWGEGLGEGVWLGVVAGGGACHIPELLVVSRSESLFLPFGGWVVGV